MKRNILKKIAEVSLFLVFSFYGCNSKDKTDNGINVTPPTIETQHSINGIVTNVQGEPIANANIVCTLSDKTYSTNSQTDGTFSLSGLKEAGNYQLTASAPGKTNAIAFVNIDQGKTSKHKNISLMMTKAVEPVWVDPKSVTEKISINTTTETGKNNNLAQIPVTLDIPVTTAKSFAQPVNIIASPIANITAPTVTSKAENSQQSITLLTMNFEPSELAFSQPMTLKVGNTITQQSPKISFKNLSLYSLKNGSWVKESQTITTDENGDYQVPVYHFSVYKIVPNLSASTQINTNTLSINGIDNQDGSAIIYVESIPYTYERGWEYSTAPDVALTAIGISDPAAIQTVDEAIAHTLSSRPGITNATGFLPVNKGIDVGIKLSVTGKQSFETITFPLEFLVDGATQKANIVVRKAGNCEFNISATNREQHSGGQN